MRIAVGSDHGGFETKQTVVAWLKSAGHDVEDLGCYSTDSVDYPDYARDVASRVADGHADEGVLVCTTGIGMSMAANKVPGVRAALCFTPALAEMARSHNNANVLVLAGSLLSADAALKILEVWMTHTFSQAERHARRIAKMSEMDKSAGDVLQSEDPDMAAAIGKERSRQQGTVNLIASENYVSRAVTEAQGSVLINKYAEGYPGKRWYSGCEFVDVAESLAIERAKALYGAAHANVQPHCGSSANMAVYMSVLEPGDTIMAMSLAHGGHLTHGHKINFSGRLYNIVPYGVNRETELIHIEEVAALARECKPKLIVVGASAYPRKLDFEAFQSVADEVGALVMVDMAHIAGLVAGGCHTSPVPFADFITTTTHKTLRGPRGGMILSREEHAKAIDKQVFPGIQGGPEMHTIAAKAVCFGEAQKPEFREYAAQVVANAAVLAEELAAKGFRIVSGGTDNHLLLVDLTDKGITGSAGAAALERCGIVVNKNSIPFDARGPLNPSGIRIGTPAMTTRGLKEPEMKAVAGLVADVLQHIDEEAVVARTREQVADLAAGFPVP